MTLNPNSFPGPDEMLNLVSDGFFSLDKNLIITNVNNLFLSWLKLTRKDAIGKHLDELSKTEKEKANYRRRYQEVLDTGIPTRFFEIYGEKTVEINAYKTSGNEVAIFFKDVTLIELARKNLARIFEHAPAAFALIEGENLNYTLTNNKFNSLFSGDTQNVVPEADIREVMQTGLSKFGSEVQFGEYYLSYAIDPYYDYSGKKSGVVLVCHDITEAVQARKKAEEAVSIREEFLSLASHELKTPLTSLHLQNEITRKILSGLEVSGPDQERLGKSLGIIQSSIQRLNSLIDSMLDVSKIHNGKLVLARGDHCLNAIVESVVTNLSMQLEGQGFHCKVDHLDEVWSHCDSFRIEQVISNLLLNSMKYASAGEISITVKKNGPTAEISVKDQGKGILAGDLQKIFLRFEQVNNLKSGLGLGLYICREIVTGHNGQINVESLPGQGTTFRVYLPAI